MTVVLHRLFRSLHVLALFQLLGGPLVLGGLVVLAKLGHRGPLDVAAMPGQMLRAMNEVRAIEEGWTLDPTLSGNTTNRSAPAKPTAPDKPANGHLFQDMAKMGMSVAIRVPRAPERPLSDQPPPVWLERRWTVRPHAPPSPPPRSV